MFFTHQQKMCRKTHVSIIQETSFCTHSIEKKYFEENLRLEIEEQNHHGC
jgi:hypothetical protein